MLVRSTVRGRRPEFGAAVIAGILEGDFILRRAEAMPAACVWLLRLAHLADPALEFIGIEMAVAAVGERGEGAVFERQQRRIGAFGRARRIPRAEAARTLATWPPPISRTIST